LAYRQEVIMPMDYIMPSLWTTAVIDMAEQDTMEECLIGIFELEEECFLVSFHQ